MEEHKPNKNADTSGERAYKGVSRLALEPTSISLLSKYIFYSMRIETTIHILLHH